MWIFTQKGFLSIVQDRKEKNNLLVRARIKGDIEKHFPAADVEETPTHDYRFRTILPKAAVAGVLAELLMDINYDAYKDHIQDHERRSDTYWSIWRMMNDLQHEIGETDDS